MGTISNALRFVKGVTPQILANPLSAPSIIRRHLGGQTLMDLANLIDLDDDGSGAGPQYGTMQGAPVPVQYGVMGGAPVPVQYGVMGGAPAPVQYGVMGGAPAPVQYGVMGGAPAPVQYGVMGGAPGVGSPQYGVMSGGRASMGGGGSSSSPGGSTALGSSVAHPNLSNIPMIGMRAHGITIDKNNPVKYVDLATRIQKYEVDMQKTITRRGTALDTKDVKGHFASKGTRQVGCALFGRTLAENDTRFKQMFLDWGYASLIWVCVREAGGQNAVFYSHCSKPNRFHHSSFTSGGDVIGAGEWIVEKGRLLKISANSGHYRPPLDAFHRAVLFMSNAWQPNTVVLLWNVRKDDWEEVPVQTFRNNPTNGGNWKTHPNA